MKKFLLLSYLLSLVVFIGYAQNISLNYEGNLIPNDGVVVFTGEPSTPLIVATMGVTNISTGPIDVMCKKVEISIVPETQNTFCWDVCYPPNVYVSLGALTLAPGETTNVFTGDYEPLTHAGQSIIRYVFFNAANPNDSICFKSFFNAYPLGVEPITGQATLSSAYPNPASSQASFNYSVEDGAYAYLLVRNVLGSTVKEIQVSGSGVANISTLDLPGGIYFYSLVVNGQAQSTRKLVVSR